MKKTETTPCHKSMGTMAKLNGLGVNLPDLAYRLLPDHRSQKRRSRSYMERDMEEGIYRRN